MVLNHSLLASATGVLLALSFPKFGHPACAWVALVPLIMALRGLGPWGRPKPIPVRRAFLLGWWAGLVYFAPILNLYRPFQRPRPRRACPGSAIVRWR